MTKKASDDSPQAAPVNIDDLDMQIAAHEAQLVELRAKKATATKVRYPTVKYKAAETVEASLATGLHCVDAQAEAEAAADGYTYEAPTKASA